MTGQSSLTLSLRMPGAAMFEGTTVHLQAAWVDLAGGGPFQLSNGLQLVLGRARPQ